jgi:hypothetical protein
MKKVFSSLLIFVLAFFIFSVSPVSAKVITSENGGVSVAKGEVVNDDLFIGAQTVEIAGTVNGDVFIGAQTVKVTGTVNGNLHVGANVLDLSGVVKGNVYGGAQNVLVSSAKIGGSLLVGAATVSIDKDSSVGGSVLVGAGAFTFDSQVKRSLYAGAGSLTIGDNTRIGKDLYYSSGDNQGEVKISESAKISGNVYKSEVDTAKADKEVEAAKKQIPGIFNGFKFGLSLISFIGALIVGFLYFKFFPKSFTESSKLVTGSFWKSLGAGFLVSISFIPGLIILLITVVGIPVAGMAILILALYSSLAKIVVGSAFGNYLSQKFNWKISTYGAFAIGLLLIYLLKMIPVIGFLAGLTVLWSGLGALTLQMFSKTE